MPKVERESAAPPKPPAKCPRCFAMSDEAAKDHCMPVEGQCPIVEAGFFDTYWPTQQEFNAKLEEVGDATK